MDTPARDRIVIRALEERDLVRLTKLDRAWSGRNRSAYLGEKLRRALEEADIRISLGAEQEGYLVGAVLGSVSYGEFGQPEPVAVLDTILVDKEVARQGVASAMLEQLLRNLDSLRIERIRTEVDWNDHDLLAFLGKREFRPVPRLVLERTVTV